MRSINTDILIVGAGPAGLTATVCLARAGVPTLTIARHSGTAPQPRATVTNQRTVEVFRDLGLEHKVDEVGIPLREMSNCVYATSFVGDELFRYLAYGDGDRAADYLLASPCRNYNAGQHKLEPVLLDAARGYGADVRFMHELLSIEQDPEAVRAIILDRQTGERYEVRSKYAVGADGGNSSVARQLGIEFDGEKSLLHMVNAWLEVDLSEHVDYRPGHIFGVIQPGGGSWVGSGSFLAVTPWNDWVMIRQYDASQGEPDRSDEAVVAAARALIGDPEIEIKVKGTSLWQVNNLVAREYSKGRIFLAGDAAHRHPPAGGLGSNTSIQDAFNLAWKLALVSKGKAGAGLLDSYHQERQPVGKHMVARTMQNLGYMASIGGALGLEPGQTAEESWAALRDLFSDAPGAAERRTALQEVVDLQHYRSTAHGTDIGQRYRSSVAIIDDGTPFPDFVRDSELYYTPTTHPGAHIPHAWVEKERTRVSTVDLAGRGDFALIVGVGGGPWIAAAENLVSSLGVTIPTYSVGVRCEYDDVFGTWATLREIADDGALLVRPDGYIAWRSLTCPDDAASALASAVSGILALDVHQSAAPADTMV